MSFYSVLQICIAVVVLKEYVALSPPLSKEEINSLDVNLQNTIRKLQHADVHYAQPRRDAFQHKYVLHNGDIHSERPSGTPVVIVSATPHVSELALAEAAHTISLMVRYMPSDIFNSLATKNGAGIFTKEDTLTAFPENGKFADTPHCKGICSGICSHTCLSDGRKISKLAGFYNGNRSVVLDDNVLCDNQDPYGHKENILVHEFAHLVMGSLPSNITDRIRYVYNYIKNHHTWGDSYATSNAIEYWAEATTSYFGAITRDGPTGGMNKCQFDHMCKSEQENRQWLKRYDPWIFTLLNHVYTNGNWATPSGLRPCI